MKGRYKNLLLSSTILFAFYFVYDVPSALNRNIKFKGEEFAEYKITLLYSVYAFPNILVPLLFKFLVDVKKSFMAKILCVFVLIGHSIFTLGVFISNFKIMLLGRFLFGLGGESFAVLQNRQISQEFKGKELSFAMGLFSSIARLGTVSCFLLTPMLASLFGTIAPCMTGVVLTIIGLVICLYSSRETKELEFFRSKLLELQKKNKMVLSVRNVPEIKNTTFIKQEDYNLEVNKLENTVGSGSMYVDSAILEEIKTLDTPKQECATGTSSYTPVDENPYTPWIVEQGKYKISTKQILKKNNPKMLFEEAGSLFYEPNIQGKDSFHSTFGILVAISFLFAIIWAPFYNIAPLLFQKRYNLSIVASSNMLAIIEGMTLVLIIAVSYISDKLGYKLLFVGCGSVCLLLAHFILLARLGSPYIPVVILGFAGPFISCYWACIPALVSEESLASGFALIYGVLNLGFTFSPVVVASLLAMDKTFNLVEGYMILMGLVVFGLICTLSYLNRTYCLGLNSVGKS